MSMQKPSIHQYSWRAGLTVVLVCLFQSSSNAHGETWHIVLGNPGASDLAIRYAIEDLNAAGKPLGIDFVSVQKSEADGVNTIAVGDEHRNPLTSAWRRQGVVSLEGVANPQGFEIRPVRISGARAMVVAGGSVEGDVYGLYWLWDRLRVFKSVPELEVKREPALVVRSGNATTLKALRTALRYTANWVMSIDGNGLIPWDEELLRTESATNRIEGQRLLDEAKKLHIRLLAYFDEYSYLPSELEAHHASLTPADPALWDLLQDKYRRLFTAMPELDGVCIRTGELTRVVEPLKPYDVMHEPALPEWPLDRRYRTFLQKLHEVVVGEFGKIYYHRTWVTNTTEQHSNPEVYKAIFTAEVPTENLYLSPYLTMGDRWFYQPINPTFNLTPHKMLVLLAPMNYHEGSRSTVFPTYPGLYFREGFDAIWRGAEGNIVGSQFGAVGGDGWGSNELTAYTAFRMSWNPQEDPRAIAEDFAAIHFGRGAAKAMGDVIMMSGEAFKHGLYVKPMAESIRGNTLPHLRLDTFVVQGFPALDHGKEHLLWLRRTIYEPSLPRMEEAVRYLDQGVELTVRMLDTGRAAQTHFDSPAMARKVLESLDAAHLLVATNCAYIKVCFAYFDYRDSKSDEARDILHARTSELKKTVERFRAVPGFDYKLYGIDQLIRSADAALTDLTAEEARLSRAPEAERVFEVVRTAQQKEAEVLASLPSEATKVLHWKGMVDGRDILHIRGGEVTIEHLMADAIQESEAEVPAPLPARRVSVVVRDLRSPALHPFVLEQPTPENDFTAKVYLFDQAPGYGQWEFEVYYIDKEPESLGLNAPWLD